MKSVLITGANRGIGLEFTKEYVKRGWHVVGACREPDKAKNLKETGAVVVPLDIADPSSVKALRKHYDTNSFDLVIANAGVSTTSTGFVTPELTEFRKVMETNTLGSMRFAEAFVDTLQDRHGMFAVISSRRGSIGELWTANEIVYGMSKAALNFMSRALAMTVKPKGITVIAFTPGHVRTDMGGPAGKISVEESVSGMCAVIDRVGIAETGEFFSYTGDRVNC